MLARQCGRHGRAPPPFTVVRFPSSPRFRCPSKATLPVSDPSIWITEDLLLQAFQSFFARGLSTSQARCEFNSEDYSRRLLRRRMSMTRVEAVRHDQLEAMGCNKWNETPPTFSWSMEQLPRIGTDSNGLLRNRYPAESKISLLTRSFRPRDPRTGVSEPPSAAERCSLSNW